MDKKMSSRIVGTLVLLALAIIFLPLFTGNDSKSLIKSANLTTPAFPVSDHSAKTDEQLQVARLPETEVHKSMEKMLSSKASLASLQTPAAPVVQLKVLSPVVKMVASAAPESPVVAVPLKVAVAMPVKAPVKVAVAAPVKAQAPAPVKTAVEAPVAVAAVLPAPEMITVGENEKIDVAAAVLPAVQKDQEVSVAAASQKAKWVVQLGSFKNKKNAERLKTALLTKGFKAFMFETKSNGQTRVYVGPEPMHAAAKELVTQIQAALKIQGVIVDAKL